MSSSSAPAAFSARGWQRTWQRLRNSARAPSTSSCCSTAGWCPLPSAQCRVSALHGDLRDAALLDGLFAQPPDAVFHLAATLTLEAESDFRQGLETNVLALIALLERCRAQNAGNSVHHAAFASSISTFGGPLPEVVDDGLAQTPATSYGAHKVSPSC